MTEGLSVVAWGPTASAAIGGREPCTGRLSRQPRFAAAVNRLLWQLHVSQWRKANMKLIIMTCRRIAPALQSMVLMNLWIVYTQRDRICPECRSLS